MTECLRILVVDDEPGMRLGVARALRDYFVPVRDINGDVRFTIDQASSGEQALEMIRAQPPDILLLDHKLPGMSGLEVLERIAPPPAEGAPTGAVAEQVPQPPPVLTIMITAYASLETAISATKRGAYDFLAKPFTPAELKATIRKATEHLVIQRQAHKLAAEKRQMRFQFISVLAHELKAPLAAIEGYLHITRERSAGDDPKVYDHILDRSLTRLEGMRKMISDLLDLTRIESGQKHRELTDLNVREVAQAAIETALPPAQARNIAIELNAPPAVPMKADRGEIEIMLNNLISNAVKYNRDGGKVNVRIEQGDGVVTLTVSDTGIGLSDEESSRLFSDFVRIKNAKTRDIIGSGLGLSIVKKLASLYQGQVSVASQADVGSTFTVTLRQQSGGDSSNGPARDNTLAARG